MTETKKIEPIIDSETGLAKLEGFLYDQKELVEGCRNNSLHERVKDLDSLCEERSFNATYEDLRYMADSGSVHMFYSSDNYEVNELAEFIEGHPYLFVELTLEKETDLEKPPYKLTLKSIVTLSSFYEADDGAEWIHLVDKCMYRKPWAIEAERHAYSDGEDSRSCMLSAYFE